MNIIGKLLGGRYEIIKEVGCGGMACVYLAQCKLLNRKVAVKVLRPELAKDKEFLRRFETEAQAAAGLSHPNIVSVYDVGMDGDLQYIIMEYVEGRTLKEYIDEQKLLPWQEAVNYAAQICEALKHAHKNGVVHRDIKPHNIIMTNDGVLKVTDFGIACAATKNTVTISGNAIGSVHYFSPEQARGGVTDAKSDIYSLGIVMYEMLTGKVPFDGESHVSIAIKHIQEKPVSPKEYNVAVPLAVEAIVMKAMEKMQENRYESASAMLADLHTAEVAPEFVPVIKNTNDDFGKTVKFKETDEVINKVREIGKKEYEKSKIQTKEEQDKDKKTIMWAAITSAAIIIAFVVGLVAYFGSIGGGAELNVPDVIGMDFEEAKEKYKKDNVNIVMIQEVDSTEFEKGEIVEQDPKDGTLKKTPFDISVTVSKGIKTSNLSNYERQEYTNVEFELKNLGFEVVKEEEHSETIPKETVIKTNPEAGSSVKTGEKIIVYVSKGPQLDMFPMPNLVGKSYAEAKRIIENNNLKLGETKRVSDSKPNGTVIGQSIAENSEVEEYATVDLTVSRGLDGLKTKSYTINVPQTKETTKIVVVQNGSVIHNSVHSKSEGNFSVTLSGTDSLKLEIYFDDVLVKQETVNL